MKRLKLLLLGVTALMAAGSLAQAADEDTDNKFSIHGEVRFRGEGWYNLVDFTDTDNAINNSDVNDSQDIWPYRVRLAASGDLGHDIWIYGEFQAAGVAGGGIFGETDPLFGDETEFLGGSVSLYQGYVKVKDLGDSVTDLTFGRMEVVFDRGLHFSSLEFYNGISHDGVMAGWDWEDMGLHAFWLRNSENNLAVGTPVPGDADDNTVGVHWNTMVGKGDSQDIAAYVFWQLQNDPGIVPGQDRGSIYTVGGRWGHDVKGENGFLWNLEAAYQFGDIQPCANPFFPLAACTDDTGDLTAYIFEGGLGFNWHAGKTDQTLFGTALLASGDGDATDEDVEMFQPLFPDFHNRLGYADLLNLTNVMSVSVGYKVNVDDRHIFGAQFYDFRKAEENDTNISPLTLTPLTPSQADCLLATGEECNEDAIGQELDLTYTFALSNNFSFDTALAYFFPGQAMEDHQSTFGNVPGEEDWGSDDAWRIYGQARARF